jgi:hypothetical protein
VILTGLSHVNASGGYAAFQSGSGVASKLVYSSLDVLTPAQAHSGSWGTIVGDPTAGGAVVPPTVLNSGTFDLTSVTCYQRVLDGTNSAIAVSHAAAGLLWDLILQQDATGSRTTSFSADFIFPAGTAPTPTPTANTIDYYRFKTLSATQQLQIGVSKNLPVAPPVSPPLFTDTFSGGGSSNLEGHTADTGQSWLGDAPHSVGGHAILLDGAGGIYGGGGDSANIPSGAMPTGDFEVKIGYKDYGGSGGGSQIALTLFDSYSASPPAFNGANALVRFADSTASPGWGLRLNGNVGTPRYNFGASANVILRVQVTGFAGATITVVVAYSTDGTTWTDMGLTATVAKSVLPAAAIGPYFSGTLDDATHGRHFTGPFTFRNYP